MVTSPEGNPGEGAENERRAKYGSVTSFCLSFLFSPFKGFPPSSLTLCFPAPRLISFHICFSSQAAPFSASQADPGVVPGHSLSLPSHQRPPSGLNRGTPYPPCARALAGPRCLPHDGSWPLRQAAWPAWPPRLAHWLPGSSAHLRTHPIGPAWSRASS